MNNMSRFDEIQAFIQIVEHGSMTAAAERLGLAKSAVSRRLSELEARLGVELFHRTTRKMSLTDSGRSFYDRTVRIVSDLDEAEQAISQSSRELRGKLKIAAPLSFGLLHLGAVINDFSRQHPHIRFEIDFNDRQVNLIEEGFDLAIRIARLRDSSLIARRIASMSIVTCASPTYLQQYGEPQHPSDLAEHQCLLYGYADTPNKWLYRDINGNKLEIQVQGIIQSNNGDYLRSAAVNGLGIVRQPRFIAYQSITRGELVPILQDYAIPDINAYAIYPPTRHLSQRVRVFIDYMRDRFSGVPYWEKSN